MLAKRLVYHIIAYECYLFMMSVTVFGPKVTRQTPETDLYMLRCRCEGFHQLLGYKDTKIVSGFMLKLILKLTPFHAMQNYNQF